MCLPAEVQSTPVDIACQEDHASAMAAGDSSSEVQAQWAAETALLGLQLCVLRSAESLPDWWHQLIWTSGMLHSLMMQTPLPLQIAILGSMLCLHVSLCSKLAPAAG